MTGKTRLQLNARLVFNLYHNEMGFNFDLEIWSESMGLSDRPGSMPWSMAAGEYAIVESSLHHR